MSCRSCRVNWQGGREQNSTDRARYSQLIRIIDCQACGTEGTEWRRRGPLSLCVRPPSPSAWVSLSVSLSVSVSVSASVFLHVLIVTRRSIRARARARAGGRAGRPSKELQPDAGNLEAGPDTTRRTHTDRYTHARTHKLAQACFLFLVLCRDGRVEAPSSRRRGLAEERVETRG